MAVSPIGDLLSTPALLLLWTAVLPGLVMPSKKPILYQKRKDIGIYRMECNVMGLICLISTTKRISFLLGRIYTLHLTLGGLLLFQGLLLGVGFDALSVHANLNGSEP
ncbi:hypothetical protein B0T26DRAFT_731211 [Lasiosphaeria miniovina]|uniref:Uncharacterized protein n=1 Tax=Lasiosphaeria miniovina TaxID=1954250 RepID=A0AA39ZTR3_9PEZI|nr:uncharacterized protein B0T26DRAFT_731211 [Lasiosphaeria miniovina]KAK0703410.1 hypothetical protein B0T26DRAFT_731211 [Lasiosphaeria miniovina]